LETTLLPAATRPTPAPLKQRSDASGVSDRLELAGPANSHAFDFSLGCIAGRFLPRSSPWIRVNHLPAPIKVQELGWQNDVQILKTKFQSIQIKKRKSILWHKHVAMVLSAE
jgi:hypothetical protein